MRLARQLVFIVFLAASIPVLAACLGGTATPVQNASPTFAAVPVGGPSVSPPNTLTPRSVPPGSAIGRTTELRAAWVHDNSIATAAKIDEVVKRAEEGHINTIVANVFTQGQVLFDSNLVRKHVEVPPDFDPLAYLVKEAHHHNIQVHAWFANGPVDYQGKSDIIAQHPDWAIVGADGKRMDWLNFQKPEVRQFISDLMMETVTRYGVDGVFFDLTRYPGPEWGFDDYSIKTFDSTHSFDAASLRYPELPAYALYEGNPLIQPSTARVLAVFSDGTPAVTVNMYGQGQVILLNWKASDRQVAATSEIMRRSVNQLLKEGGQVALFKPDGELDDNAQQAFDETGAWLQDLGWPPHPARPADVQALDANSVLVVSYGYALPGEAAAQLAGFVQRGGGLIFVDGPVRSLTLDAVRRLTGMQARGKQFEGWMMMTAQGDDPLIPNSHRPVDLATAQAHDAEWKDFRKQGVDTLIRQVYARVKAGHPQVEISVTVTSDQKAAAEKTMQDWQAWLKGGYVDFIVPRGYVEDIDELDRILAAWQPIMQEYKRVTLGVSTFNGKHSERTAKSPQELLAEITRAHGAGSYGIMIWNLDYISDQQLQTLANGPFAS